MLHSSILFLIREPTLNYSIGSYENAIEIRNSSYHSIAPSQSHLNHFCGHIVTVYWQLPIPVFNLTTVTKSLTKWVEKLDQKFFFKKRNYKAPKHAKLVFH